MLMPLLAAATLEENERTIRTALETSKPSISRETILVLVAIGVLSAILLIWALFIRKRPKDVHGSKVIVESDRKSQRYGSSGRRRHRKRRPNHPDNWGRNPTLAETGGLPPLRSDDPPPPGTNPPSQGFSPPV